MYYFSTPLNVLINNLYCKIYPIHDIYKRYHEKYIPGTIMKNNFTILPTTIENSYERIEIKGIYLIDNSEYIYIYVLEKADLKIIK